jgi:hypothetical protein
MLDTSYSKSHSKKPTIRVYLGQYLAREARKGNATQRAELAAEAVGAHVHELTVGQAVALTGASRTYVAELRRMTELERAAVAAGRIKLSDRVNHSHKSANDADLDKMIREIGVDRVFAALDRITTPVAA